MSNSDPHHPHLHPFARWNLLFAYVSLFYFGLADNIRGPLYPEITATFGLSNADSTWFFALASCFMIIGSFLMPSLLKKMGYLAAFRWGLLFLTGAQFIYATSSNFSGILVGSVFMGLCIGILGVMQNLMVLVAAPPERLPRFMGGLHANYGAASLLAPLVVAGVAMFTPVFQGGFWVVGALGIFLLGSTFLVPGFVESRQQSETKPQDTRITGGMLRLALILSSYVWAEILISTRLAQFVRLERGASLAETGYWTSVFFIGLFLSRLSLIFFSFTWSPRKQLGVALVTALISGLIGTLITPWGFLIAGFAMGPCYPLAMSLVREAFPHQLEKATTVCIVMSAVFIVAMHLSTGFLTDSLGIQGALLTGPAFLGLAFLLLCWRKSHSSIRACD